MTLEGGRLPSTTRSRSILLDEDRPDYLGGQFVHAAVASLDWAGMVDFFRTGAADPRRGPTATASPSSA